MRWPRLRRRAGWGVVGLLLVIVAAGAGVAAALSGTAGSGMGTWFTARSPRLQVSARSACLPSVAGYADVVNTFPGPPLVPADPTTGLICRYGPGVGLGPDGSGRSLLVSRTRLGHAQALQLAGAIRQIDLAAPPSGVVACPADDGAVTLIGLSYLGRADVGLWYTTTGCQMLDNGRIGAWEVGNPSFYDGFEGVIDQLSPPVETNAPPT